MQSRFLHIQIYNETGTEVEYDNLIDTDWGIQVASASLNSQIMEKELRFGEMFSSMFQVVLYNLDVDLKGRRIKVGLNYNTGDNCIVDGSGNKILVGDETYLVYREMADVSQVMFDGYIISSTKDRQGSDRTILAYDSLYTLRDINVADFWNEYWEDNETSTLEDFRNALLTYVNLSPVSDDFINDDLVVQNHFDYDLTQLRFQDLMKMICELQNTCPHLNPNTRNLDFISLRTVALHDIRQKVEGQNSSWEDFTTEQITGVGVYITGGELAQIVGGSANVYNLVGNVFLNGASAEKITEACTNILAELSTIQFVPGSFKLILSEPDWNLGDKIYSKYGMSYMFATKFFGSVLIDETISCKQSDAFLNKNVESYDDKIIEGLKVAQIEKTVDSFKIDYADFKEDVSTEFEQTADTIVLKVDSQGNVGTIALGVTPDPTSQDPSERVTQVDINADFLKFKANTQLDLEASKLNITSDNFSVDEYGHLESKSGVIGGWSIGTDCLYKEDGSLDPDPDTGQIYYARLKMDPNSGYDSIIIDDRYYGSTRVIFGYSGIHFYRGVQNFDYSDIEDWSNWNFEGMWDMHQTGLEVSNAYLNTPYLMGSYLYNTMNVYGTIDLRSGGTIIMPSGNGIGNEFVQKASGTYTDGTSKTTGYVMHGRNTGHTYQCNWGSNLQFWVDVTNVANVSDRRLKEDIEEVNPNLVKAICECKTYQYKAFNRNGLISVGIIAQDFVANCEKYGIDPMDYEVCQTAIFKADDDTEYYYIEYSQYLTLKSIHLQNQIDELQSLKDEIAELKSDIEELKNGR